MRLEGRRLWFVGIGGAGLSGYALLAQAWGAEVAGWDRYETPYLEHVRAAGIPVTISDSPVGPPEGWEAVISTAFATPASRGSRCVPPAPGMSPSLTSGCPTRAEGTATR